MAVKAIEKRGTFKSYTEACKAYVKLRKVVKQAKATLGHLTATVSRVRKLPRNLPRSF
jgi:hypothetical protein